MLPPIHCCIHCLLQIDRVPVFFLHRSQNVWYTRWYLMPEEEVILPEGIYFLWPKDCPMKIPDVLKRLADVVQQRQVEHYWRYHLFLTRSPAQSNTGRGYRALARLIRDGYFLTILTSNTDTALEDELAELDEGP